MASIEEAVAAMPAGGGDRQVSSDSEDPTSVDSADSDSDEKRKEQAQQIRKSFKHPALWMLVLGFMLAACAGAVDVIVFEELGGTFVSHQTGSLAKVGMELQGVHMVREYDPYPASEHLLVIMSFTFGAFLCGLVIDKNTMHFGGNSFYGVALVGNSALLFAALAVLPGRSAAYLAAMACGLQNAMCTSHFTAVVRTTHVTGSFTDIGSTAGRIVAILLRRRCGRRIKHVDKAEMWVDGMKLQILSLLCMGFLLGCFFGAYLYEWLGKFSLAAPASITLSIGVSYMLVTHLCKRQVTEYENNQRAESVREVEECIMRAHEILVSQRGSESDLEAQPPALAAVDGEMEHCLEIVRGFSRDWIDPRQDYVNARHNFADRGRRWSADERSSAHPSRLGFDPMPRIPSHGSQASGRASTHPLPPSRSY